MVRKRTKFGGYYHEPPYTPEEDAEFYRRFGGGPIAFTRPGPSHPAEPERSPEGRAANIKAPASKARKNAIDVRLAPTSGAKADIL
jgi:hypothetical protein